MARYWLGPRLLHLSHRARPQAPVARVTDLPPTVRRFRGRPEGTFESTGGCRRPGRPSAGPLAWSSPGRLELLAEHPPGRRGVPAGAEVQEQLDRRDDVDAPDPAH